MKRLWLYPGFVLALIAARSSAQPTQSVVLGSTYDVSSSHGGSGDGYQNWSALSLASPSGRWYSEDTHGGLDRPDGYTSRTVTLNETGIWQVWYLSGYSGTQAEGSYLNINLFLNVQPAAPPNRAPSIAWTSTPGTVASGQSYSISAHGHDDDGNLAQVNVWKNGQPFAFAGGGNGFDGDSGNSTSDSGPQTVTFSAQAVDRSGATSPMISWTVTVNAPPVNHTPTISWNTAPGTVASGQSYTISAHGHDQDGNLAQVNVWRNGSPYAFAGGGTGFDGDSGNPSSDTGPLSITYTANAVDSNGAASGTISQTVTIAAPNRAPTTAITGDTILQVGQTGSWTFSASDADGNLQRWRFYASTNGNPQWSPASGSSASGGYSTSFSSAGTYTWIVEAQDAAGAAGSASISVLVTAPPVSGSIATNPASAIAPGSATISWSSANATSVAVNGPGLSSGAGSGSQVVSGLAAGVYAYTLTAQGSGGPLVRTATFTVSAPPPPVTGNVAVTPATGTAPGSTTVSWTTTNATSVSVTGSGLNSTLTNSSQTVSGLGAGTYTYTLTAQGSGGPITRTATFTVGAAAFALTTATNGGGSVTPGGTYPSGTLVTIAASPNATNRFTGWSGDASGTAPSIAILIDRAKFVQANFTGKAAQTIVFPSPGDRAVNSAPVTLNATASSGLPIGFSVLSGPATLNGGQLQVTGPGAVTVQADQPGDAIYLPAPSVARTFNSFAPAVLKYRTAARTLFQSDDTRGAQSVVLENP